MEELKHSLKQYSSSLTRDGVVRIISEGVKYMSHEKVESYRKRDIVIKVVRDIVIESGLPKNSKEFLLDFIDNAGVAIIDTLVEFGKDTKMFVKKRCNILCKR